MAQSLTVRTKFFYGVGSVAEAGVTIAFNTFNFLFYNNVLGLPGTLAGLAVTIAVVFDALSDPIVGSISDRWRSRFGRRHPFLFFSALPLGLCFLAIYAPPAMLGEFGLFLWFTTFTIALRLALTFYLVPHLALGAELSDDYRERSVVMGYNAILGMIGGSATFFLCWTWLGGAEGGTSNRASFLPIGLGVGAMATLFVWGSAYFTRDRIPRLKQVDLALPAFSLRALLDEIGGCLANRNYLWLLLGMLCLAATNGVRETIGAYVNLFFWELRPEQLRFFGLTTPLAVVVAFIATPRLNARFDKRPTMLCAVTIYVIVTTLPVCLRIAGLLPANGHPALFPILATFTAVYYGAGAVLMITVLSALADVADEHELATGRRQEGIFYSARSFVSKLTGAVGVFVGGIAIDLIGWPRGVERGDPVDPATVLELGLIDGPVAALPSLIAIYCYGSYAIDRAQHTGIQRALRDRKRAQGTVDDAVRPTPSTTAVAAADS